jgi:hypothetical protein
LEHIPGNPHRAIPLVPDALQQAGTGEGDIELAAVKIGVRSTPEEQAAGKLSVPARSTRLLIVRLGRGRRSPVHHQPHGRFVDPHPECAGGNDDVHAIPEKVIECSSPGSLAEAGVIRRRTVPRFGERAGHGLGAPTSRSVDDRHGIVAAKERQQSLETLPFAPNLH